MNSLKNSVRLVGHLGNNPDVKEIASGKKVAKISLATNESYRKNNGDQVTETQWHNCVAWGKTAEIAEKYLQKGQEVCIEGRLNNRSWEDADGKMRYATEVVINELLMVGKKAS